MFKIRIQLYSHNTTVATDVGVCVVGSVVMRRTTMELTELEEDDRRPSMSKWKRVDAGTQPWETPAFTGNGGRGTTSTRMEMVRLLRELHPHGTN